MQTRYLTPLGLMASMTLFTVGCKPQGPSPQQTQGAPPPAEVGVVEVQKETIMIKTPMPGRLAAVKGAEVRARATGINVKQHFPDGAEVKEGQLLYEIDPAPYEAALESAKAALAKAEANLGLAQVSERRLKTLVDQNAVSKQEYDEAASKVSVARADILGAKAALTTAELNLSYTKVRAPISGIVGKGFVSEGALMSAGEATIMAKVQILTPIFLEMQFSSVELLKLRRAMNDGTVKRIHNGSIPTALILEDGTRYEHMGEMVFTDSIVDATTGMVHLRATFPNPDNLLLPGMFGTGIIEKALEQEAITLPQQAVTQNGDGTGTVLVVGPDQTVVPKTVKTAGEIDHKWIITDGISPGEKVIAEGVQKVRPGSYVKTVPYVAPAPKTEESKSVKPEVKAEQKAAAPTEAPKEEAKPKAPAA